MDHGTSELRRRYSCQSVDYVPRGVLMPATLRDIQVLRTVLGRLNAERRAERRPAEGSLARTLYQDRGGDFRRRLRLAVESRKGKARVLVTGQIGVGKSSELWDFREECRHISGLGYPIFCDLEKEESPERCGSTGLFLTILRDCWAATLSFAPRLGESARRDLDAIRDEILTNLVDWLKGTYTDDGSGVVFAYSGMDYPVLLSDKPRALAIILGKASLHESVAEQSQRFALAPDALVILLNKLLRWFARNDQLRPPLLIIDHVDKIRDQGAAEDVLVKVAPQWNRVEAALVMTAPFEYTLGPVRTSVESRWDKILMLYPLSIPELGAGEVPQIYRAIAQSAGLGALISDDALRVLAHFSGGILRMFVQFLAEAAQEAHLAGCDRIERGEAHSVVFKAEQAYLDYGAKELQLLNEIERLGGGLGEAASLLRSPIGLLVNERRGKSSVEVHPLARTRLGQYRYRITGAKA
jgi:hypothetical protein